MHSTGKRLNSYLPFVTCLCQVYKYLVIFGVVDNCGGIAERKGGHGMRLHGGSVSLASLAIKDLKIVIPAVAAP
jgi:hypothetical protein